ncbi:MAG: hypothetical protein Q8P59_14740, partial [Dehalococcoidia bacterium]|nr:hypothetical protein [Dehalococcoidia bacterium]
GITEAGLTGTYNGQDTIAKLNQKMAEIRQQADIAKQQGDSVRADQFQVLLQQTQDQANELAVLNQKLADIRQKADIAKQEGDSVRADQYEALLQQTQDQANALATQKQTADLTGYTDAGGGGKQLTAAQRNWYITNYGYDPGALGEGITGSTSTIAGRVQTEAEKAAQRKWEVDQATMAANPENAATFAALRGRAPWQQGWQGAMSGGQGGGQGGGGQGALGSFAAGGQTGIAEQNSPAWGSAGITNARDMNLQSYDTMNQSQKSAFGSFAKAAGGSTEDYEKQLNTYRPQRTKVTEGDWTG